MRLNPVAIALLAAASAGAQSLPELRTEAVSGGSVFYVKNTSPQPLAAYLIELVDYPGSSYALFQDEVAAPLAPNAEKRIPVTNMTVGAVPDYVKITAAVYADGTVAGAPDKVALILGRRKSRLETTRELIRRIDKAQQSGTAKAALAAELKTWADSLQPQGRRSRMTPETVSQAAAQQTVASAAAYLEGHSIEETVADLKTTERGLARAKP